MRTVSPSSATTRLTNDLSRIARVVQHHNVAGLGLAEELVGCLVHDQSILILQRRLHALALDTRNLKPKRDNQRGIHGR